MGKRWNENQHRVADEGRGCGVWGGVKGEGIMENSFYVLAESKINVTRLHISTWDLLREDALIEFGVELEKTHDNDIALYLITPSLEFSKTIRSLHYELSDQTNSRFIFNDTIKSVSPFNKSDNRDGAIVSFDGRGELSILAAEHEFDGVALKIAMQLPERCTERIYIRFLLEIERKTLAILKHGIARSSYIYDIKINEKRNLSDVVHKYITKNKLYFCNIKQCFCFHIIPDNFEISFVDNSKVKAVRKLESAFSKYLETVKSLKKDRYIIVFNKDESKEGEEKTYSFFSVFNEEIIGTSQVIVAVTISILCNLLFAIGNFRVVRSDNISWFKQVPVEYYCGLIVLVIGVIYIFFNKRLKNESTT
ncbi:MAG: hypothetical protein LBB74_09145 [Chitinispirillales bacterium]|nr:hypothetical protein [Chitinispirillales bacterium]